MTPEEKNKLLLSDTSVPDLFISQYMYDLSADSIRMYLMILSREHQSASGRISIKNIGKQLSLTEAKAEEAFFYLMEVGLMEKNADGTLSVVDIKAREIDRYIEAKTQDEALPMPPQHVKAESAMLAKSICNSFFAGKMDYKWYRQIDRYFDEYHFDAGVIYALFTTLMEKGKSLNTVTAANGTAKNWYNRGIRTTEDLEKAAEEDKVVMRIVAELGKLMRRRFDDIAIEQVTKWYKVYGYDEKVIGYAYRELRTKRQTVNFQMVEVLLDEWHTHQVRDERAARAYQEKKANAAAPVQAMEKLLQEKARKQLDGNDMQYITAWLQSGYSESLVSLAYDKVAAYTKPTFKRMDEKLLEWKNEGVSDEVSINAYEAYRKEENKKKYQEEVKPGKSTSSGRKSNSTDDYESLTYTQEDFASLHDDAATDLEALLNMKKNRKAGE
ncbi:MAG TPA: DnaD domain protein [Bacillota bacterium]|nr:DnaD domain protein [Bacillota bacterium]HPE39280.1 DnaD domain protein [Bacillota bacterium]